MTDEPRKCEDCGEVKLVREVNLGEWGLPFDLCEE